MRGPHPAPGWGPLIVRWQAVLAWPVREAYGSQDLAIWVEPRGLEPLTPCLQSRCATNCAMAPRAPARERLAVGSLDVVGDLGPQVALALLLRVLAVEDVPRTHTKQCDEELLHRSSVRRGEWA